MQLLVSVMSYLIPSKLSLYICLNSFEQMKVIVRNKDCPSHLLLSWETSMSVRGNRGRITNEIS